MEEPVVPAPTLIIRLSSVQFSDLSLCLGARVLHYFKDKTKNIYHSATQLTRLRFVQFLQNFLHSWCNLRIFAVQDHHYYHHQHYSHAYICSYIPEPESSLKPL